MPGLTRRDLVGAAVGLAVQGCAERLPTARTSALGRHDRVRRTFGAKGTLEAVVRGRVLHPASSDRLVYNTRFDHRRPLAVVLPRDVADVQATVDWARRRDVPLTVRSGGHGYTGAATRTGAVVLDLRTLAGVRVANGRLRAGGGALLIDVHAVLARRGGMLPTGSCPAVGVGGLTQGGGMGLSGRALGLTCDRLEAFTIVTPDGRVRRCSAEREADLFWACRGGGGGNFGVVVAFEFRPARARPCGWFTVSWPWSQAREALGAWQDWAPDAPSAVTSVLSLSDGRISAIGQVRGGRADLRALTRVAGAQASTGTASPFALVKRWAGCPDLQVAQCRTTGLDGGRGTLPRARFDAGSAYVEHRLGGPGRAAFVDAVRGTHGVLLLDAYGGAIAGLAPDATAFPHRSARFSVQVLSYAADATAFKRAALDRLRPHVSGAAYVNYLDRDVGPRAYYGDNLDRLRAIKTQVDPDGVLRSPQGIRPA